MVRTAKININGTDYTMAYTPGCVQCVEDLGYADMNEMLDDKRYNIRNIMLIIESLIRCGAYQDKKAGREARTISYDELRMELSTDELNECVGCLETLMKEKPAVEADIPKK